MAVPTLAVVASVCLSSAPLLSPLLADARLAPTVSAHPGAALRVEEPGPPEDVARPGGGRRFAYALPLIAPGGLELATADVACDFDAESNFVGARLLTVRAPAVFAVQGVVKHGEAFEAPIDSTRTFHLIPFSEGWTIGVTGPGGDFCRPLTPPYRGTNALEIFGNAPQETRRFRCAATEGERAAAETSLEQVLWTEGVPWKKVDEAVRAHERLSDAAQRGSLVILALVLGPGERPWIESMRFRFELR